MQDEWGLYDPNAAGFEALYARLESIEARRGAAAEDEEAALQRKNPRPLALWAWRDQPVVETPATTARDELRMLVSQFSIPYSVAAVGYARGARIGQVEVVTPPDAEVETPDAETPVVILSRSALKMLRKQEGTQRPTAR